MGRKIPTLYLETVKRIKDWDRLGKEEALGRWETSSRASGNTGVEEEGSYGNPEGKAGQGTGSHTTHRRVSRQQGFQEKSRLLCKVVIAPSLETCKKKGWNWNSYTRGKVGME